MNLTHLDKSLPQNRISSFFAEKVILITGGSGFLGKVLIEKLLRSCTSLQKIYVILRSKRGKNAAQRLDEIFAGPLFDCLKKQHGSSIFKKVEAIPGDISAADLGLSPENRKKITEKTEIIYHSAATVKFDDPLKDTVLLNVRGTKLLLDLAKECKKLMVFGYISTAYCHEDQEVVFEKFYPPPANPHDIIKLCEKLDQGTIEKQAPQLRATNVNNYTFSKALGEALVEEQLDVLPVVVFRPSAVIPIWKEPLPGWTDNVNGPAGLLIGAGKGVIRTMFAREDTFIDCCFVDLCANAILVLTHDFHTFKSRRIYHLTASEETERLGITTQRLLDMGRDIIQNRVAFSKVLWYPNGSLKQSRIRHNIDFVMFQLLPAVVVDTILTLVGVKPFLVKVQTRIWHGYKVLEYYVNRKWIFDNENSKAGRSLMNSTERKQFKLDTDGLDTYEYFVQCFLSARKYLMKEGDDDIPAALRLMKLLRCLDTICKVLFVCAIIYMLYNWIF